MARPLAKLGVSALGLASWDVAQDLRAGAAMLRKTRLGAGLVIACVLAACASEIEHAGSAAFPKEEAHRTNDAGVVERPGSGSCGNFSLTFGPVTLPSASKVATYEVRLRNYAEPGWYGLEYVEDAAETLPPGLELTSTPEPVLRGVPTSAGSFDFTVLAIHGTDSNGCSTMPDPHSFHLDIADVDGIDAGADAE
ncbi:MAG: hypothetical protein KF782_12375 [Labilithrix sp.]|nr:hypothetical protein [Labilithrix sp.]